LVYPNSQRVVLRPNWFAGGFVQAQSCLRASPFGDPAKRQEKAHALTLSDKAFAHRKTKMVGRRMFSAGLIAMYGCRQFACLIR
jgi:hypothetical protein